ncbi:XrtY-associated glycosyltransferase XYAG1, partial [Pedobacter sp.]
IGQAQLVEGVPVYYFKRWTKDHTHFSPSLFWFLHQLITEEKKAGKKKQLIIHIHAWWNLVSIFSCLVAKWHGVKVVLSPRGMLNAYTLANNNSLNKRILHAILGKKLLNYIHILHATSSKENVDIYHFLKRKAHIIPNFVKTPTIITPSNNDDNSYHLIFLGRINEIKGLENLLLALAQVKINWQLNIVGEGETCYVENLKTLAQTQQIQHQISWLGHVNNETKFKLLSSASLLILPSFKENFANVVVEALAVGTPVLISDSVGLSDYIEQTDLGWISTNAPEQLAQTIHQSFFEKEKQRRIRAEAPEIIRRDFNEKALSKKYIEMYHTS